MKLLASGHKHSAIIDAVNRLKNGEFKATAIKVELEANLGRSNSSGDNCEYCDEGSIRCEYCDGSNEVECGQCEGNGVMDNPDHTSTNNEPEEMDCNECDGTGLVSCSECEEGYNTCDECDGAWEGYESGDFGNELECHDFILERLVEHGLAELIPEGKSYSYANKYRPVLPLVFSKFYNDGSVDSEHTFTLLLDDPTVVEKLPIFLEIFKELADAVGNEFNTRGAGMHIALLNSPKGFYCADAYSSLYTRNNQAVEFNNFSKSMNMLLPALFFLGSASEVSRGLRFREPRVAEYGYRGSKYHAINYGHGALEFRLFETCYDKPEIILDNVVVIANCMKYWRKTYKKFVMKGISNIFFGNEKDNTLKRFYTERNHIEVLNGGLRILKPSYYTITDVKKQRNFHITKATIDSSAKKVAKEVALEYKEYEQRFNWSIEVKKHQHLTRLVEGISFKPTETQEERLLRVKQAEKDNKKWIKAELTYKKQVKDYVAERLREIKYSNKGRYLLESEA